MVNKNYDLKINKAAFSKIVFYIVLLIYFFGLCSGCVFALKNRENLTFITKIMGIENMVKGENNSLFAVYIRFLARDLTLLVFLLVFKYAGVLKGMCLCVPFINGLQNSCIYIANYSAGTSVFSILTRYVIKDTAVSFLIILFCYVITADILSDRNNTKRDIRKIIVYIIGVLCVYTIDVLIKLFFL